MPPAPDASLGTASARLALVGTVQLASAVSRSNPCPREESAGGCHTSHVRTSWAFAVGNLDYVRRVRYYHLPFFECTFFDRTSLMIWSIPGNTEAKSRMAFSSGGPPSRPKMTGGADHFGFRYADSGDGFFRQGQPDLAAAAVLAVTKCHAGRLAADVRSEGVNLGWADVVGIRKLAADRYRHAVERRGQVAVHDRTGPIVCHR